MVITIIIVFDEAPHTMSYRQFEHPVSVIFVLVLKVSSSLQKEH